MAVPFPEGGAFSRVNLINCPRCDGHAQVPCGTCAGRGRVLAGDAPPGALDFHPTTQTYEITAEGWEYLHRELDKVNGVKWRVRRAADEAREQGRFAGRVDAHVDAINDRIMLDRAFTSVMMQQESYDRVVRAQHDRRPKQRWRRRPWCWLP